MSRSRPIPQQVLDKAEAGELEALRSLSLLVTAKYATVQTVEIAFKHITSCSPDPRHKAASTFLIPALALAILWELIGAKDDLRLEVKQRLVRSLLGSGDAVFNWLKFCLRAGIPCARADIVKGRDRGKLPKYVLHAHYILQLLKLDDDCRLVLSSSTAFIELFLEFWLAKEGQDDSQTGVFRGRLVDNQCDDGCAIIELAYQVLTKPQSLDAFLAYCRTGKRCDRFCDALMDRVRYGFVHTHALMGWSHSLYWLLAITDWVCISSPLIRKRLDGMGCLTALSQEVSAFTWAIKSSGEAADAAFVTVSCLDLLINCALGLDREPDSRRRRNMTALAKGDFLGALLSTTEAVIFRVDDDDDLMKKILRMVDLVRHYMVYPETFGCTDPEDTLPMPDAVRDHPRAFAAWVSLFSRHARALSAYAALSRRSTVYLCDNPFCYLVEKKEVQKSKECSRCLSVVYCSLECQEQDWEGRHREECNHARRLHDSQKEKHEVYHHQIRTSHSAYLEAIYAEFNCEAYANPTVLPIFMCRGVPMDSSQQETSVEDLNSCYMHWIDCSEGQWHLQQRARTLISLYRFGDFPPGWRLAEGIFPVNSGQFYRSIHLLALLKPEDGGFRTVYCIPCHRYARPGTVLKHETVPDASRGTHDENAALDDLD